LTQVDQPASRPNATEVYEPRPGFVVSIAFLKYRRSVSRASVAVARFGVIDRSHLGSFDFGVVGPARRKSPSSSLEPELADLLPRGGPAPLSRGSPPSWLVAVIAPRAACGEKATDVDENRREAGRGRALAGSTCRYLRDVAAPARRRTGPRRSGGRRIGDPP